MIFDIKFVFNKEGDDGNHLIPGIDQGFECRVDRATGTDCHDHLFGIKRKGILFAERICDSFPRFQISNIGHVFVLSYRLIIDGA